MKRKGKTFYYKLFKKALEIWSKDKEKKYTLYHELMAVQASIIIKSHDSVIIVESFNYKEREIKNRYCIFKLYNDIDKYLEYIKTNGVTDLFDNKIP